MRYPPFLRALLGRAPIAVNIDGKAKRNALITLDALFVPLERQEEITVEGLRLSLDVTQSAERLLFYMPDNVMRHFRRSNLGVLIDRAFTRAPGLFVDIGANLGLYSLLAQEHGAATLLFEPEPTHAAFLRRNAAHFGEVVEVALSDGCGTALLHVGDAQHSGASSLCAGTGEATAAIYSDSVEVEVATFDAVVAERGVDTGAIRLIKVDVEGNEASTLRGMTDYLARHDAAPIWCEVRGPASTRGADSYREATALTAPFGYRPFVADPDGVRPFQPERDVRQVFDLLFLVPDRHAYLL